MIHEAKKQTPVIALIKSKEALDFPECQVFGISSQIVIGDWSSIQVSLKANQSQIEEVYVQTQSRNQAVPLFDIKNIDARIEPGAVIRGHVEIGKSAVIMMGAIINIGAKIGEETMIDMGAVIGSRVEVGARCHVGANAVLAGVLEPASAKPVVLEDEVLIGANAVVLEGVHIGKGAVIGAGAIVTQDVEANAVMVGNPARKIKKKDAKTLSKTGIVGKLRSNE